MTDPLCPIACVTAACPDDTFIQKHETFLLTVIGILSTALTAMLSYFLKSRCTKIKCFGVSCTRVPIPNVKVNVNDIENVNDNVNVNETETNV